MMKEPISRFCASPSSRGKVPPRRQLRLSSIVLSGTEAQSPRVIKITPLQSRRREVLMTPASELLETTRQYLAALEQMATGDALARFFRPDVVQEEFPNRLVPQGARR